MAERISLVEAYNNRDVVAQLVRLRDDVNEILAILENIDPQGDLTNFVTKTGDEVISGIKTFTGKIVADCDIIQNGSAYETHAEQVFTTKDYIKMRDGAIAALAPGDLSGIEIENYDGLSTNCRLAVDASGVARVGDVGGEQPLATRDEVADMTSGALVKWDGVNMKMIAPSSNIGSDSKPIKIVGGEPVAVTNDLALTDLSNVTKDAALTAVPTDSTNVVSGTVSYYKFGKFVMVSVNVVFVSSMPAWAGPKTIATGLPKPYILGGPFDPVRDASGQASGWYTVSSNGTLSFDVRGDAQNGNTSRACFIYITSE